MNQLLKYSLVFYLIAQSSIPFFFGNEHLIIGFVFSLFLFIKFNRNFDRFIFIYIGIFSSLFLIHFLSANKFEIPLLGAYIIRVLFAYFTIKVLAYNFNRSVVNIIYTLTIISFIFYFPLSIMPFLQNIVNDIYYTYFQNLEIYKYNFRKNIIIYTPEYWLNWLPPRNAGPFWEPGGFATFLVIASLLNIYITRNIYDKKNLVFLLALISTFSTAAFVILILFFIFYYLYVRNFKSVAFALPLLIISAYYTYNELPFMKEKITQQYYEYQINTNEYSERSRLASTYYDIKDILNNPILGKGRVDREEYERDVNSLTAIIKQFGLVGGLTFFGFIFYSFKKLCISTGFRIEWAFYSLLIIILIGLSQSIYGKPFFMSMAFLFITIHGKSTVKLNVT